MERRIMLWIVIGVLFLVALYLVFQAGISTVAQGTISSTGSAASQAGQATSAASYGGMVGGC